MRLGSGSFAVPAGATQRTSVIPDADGSFTWQAVEAGDVAALAPEPVLRQWGEVTVKPA